MEAKKSLGLDGINRKILQNNPDNLKHALIVRKQMKEEKQQNAKKIREEKLKLKREQALQKIQNVKNNNSISKVFNAREVMFQIKKQNAELMRAEKIIRRLVKEDEELGKLQESQQKISAFQKAKESRQELNKDIQKQAQELRELKKKLKKQRQEIENHYNKQFTQLEVIREDIISEIQEEDIAENWGSVDGILKDIETEQEKLDKEASQLVDEIFDKEETIESLQRAFGNLSDLNIEQQEELTEDLEELVDGIFLDDQNINNLEEELMKKEKKLKKKQTDGIEKVKNVRKAMHQIKQQNAKKIREEKLKRKSKKKQVSETQNAKKDNKEKNQRKSKKKQVSETQNARKDNKDKITEQVKELKLKKKKLAQQTEENEKRRRELMIKLKENRKIQKETREKLRKATKEKKSKTIINELKTKLRELKNKERDLKKELNRLV